jgi:type II secretory pathway pseudopilin PulG
MNMENRIPNRRFAFSAIELLVVCAVIGILAVLIVINMGASRKRAQDSNRKSSIASYRTAIEQYRADRGTYFIYSVKLGGCPGDGNIKCTDGDVGSTLAIKTQPELNGINVSSDYITCDRTLAAGCVGYKGGGWGRFTRRYDPANHTPAVTDIYLSSYGPNSIADALLADGYISENKADPSVANFYDGMQNGNNITDMATYLANSNDFYYTICSESGLPATKPSRATRYSLFSKLNNTDTTEEGAARLGCGGPSSPSLYALR